MTTRAAREFVEEEIGPRTLGRLLRGYRSSLKLSHAELAKRLGISQARLSDLEGDRKAISPGAAKRLAERAGWPEKDVIQAAMQTKFALSGIPYKVTIRKLRAA